jgi:hypothetical protein
MKYSTRKYLLVLTVAALTLTPTLEVDAKVRVRSRTNYVCDTNFQNCKKVERPTTIWDFVVWLFFLGSTGTWAWRNRETWERWLLKFQGTKTTPQPTQENTQKPKPLPKKLPPLPDPLAKPEVAEWEVFRNGKPEGTYTREQLLNVQKITARTNVRRGSETDWTRAGEIPELADFIRAK